MILSGSRRCLRLLGALSMFSVLPCACSRRREPAHESVHTAPTTSAVDTVSSSAGFTTNAAPSSATRSSSGVAADTERAAITPMQREPNPDNIEIDLAFGGDVIPQARVLRADPKEMFADLPATWWNADARIFNFEGTLGTARELPHDVNTLAFAAPPDWFRSACQAAQVTAVVAANNHGCDLGVPGAQSLLTQAEVPVLGLAEKAPFTLTVLANKRGRKVCGVAWSTFFNEEKRFADRCRMGRSTPKFARATSDREGARLLAEVLPAAIKAAECDATVAYIHGGVEYRAQSPTMRTHLAQAAKYVDALIVSHPHVPDQVDEVLLEGDRAHFQTSAAHTAARKTGAKQSVALSDKIAPKHVPVFLSLGNMLSNQGVGWDEGMRADEHVEDPIRSVWTRVGLLAALRFSFREHGLAHVAYGYNPIFVDRKGPTSAPKLVALSMKPNVVKNLESVRVSRAASAGIFHHPCRMTEPDFTHLPCTTQNPALVVATTEANSIAPIAESKPVAADRHRNPARRQKRREGEAPEVHRTSARPER
jgi:Bacterial capsule synthesis protein PGA_cap